MVYLWVNPFHNELSFLKGPIKLMLTLARQWWVFGILVWTDTCFWNEEPNSSSKSGQSFSIWLTANPLDQWVTNGSYLRVIRYQDIYSYILILHHNLIKIAKFNDNVLIKQLSNRNASCGHININIGSIFERWRSFFMTMNNLSHSCVLVLEYR